MANFDYEAETRRELIELLSPHFFCKEEVMLENALFVRRVRADVIASPKESKYSGLTFAFEVKVPKQNWELKNWLHATKQASDYVWGQIVDETSVFASRRVNAAFVYPGPNLLAWANDNFKNERFFRDYDVQPLRGVFDLALHFRVGTARLSAARSSSLELKFSTNRIWSAQNGFSVHADNLLMGPQRLGSASVSRDHLRQI